MDRNKIFEYIEQTANDKPKYIEPVGGGLSNVLKCKTEVCGQPFMVKIFSGNPTRELWYTELNKRTNCQMANPKMHKLFTDGNLCLLSPWIEGECLETILQSATKDQINNYGIQAAEIMLQLHKTSIEYPAYQDNLKKRINDLCIQVDNYKLSFPGKEIICDYLKKISDTYTVDHLCFVHKDIRPENFVVQDEKLFLIDFDNGSLGERATDFSYLTTMVRPEHYEFAYKLIETYLSKLNETNFWQTNLLYSAMQVVEYAVWKWQTKEKQVFFQAENFMKQYEGFMKNVPAWWVELEDK